MIEVQIGDSRRLIHGLADKSIDCVVTSPPYWGLRDYKTKPIIFDGSPECEHNWQEPIKISRSGGTNGGISTTQDDSIHIHQESNFCSKCGAWRGQLGLEPTPELFIKHLLDFFDNVKLKLKDEGNCFVNLGDSYAGSGVNDGTKNAGMSNAANRNDVKGTSRPNTKVHGLKPKCLCMIPQRFAWGMIEHGWILRNEIIWAKPNHMPESVTDRLTKSHEVIYHFVKQQKYYYDLDAIREPITTKEKRPMGIIRSREWGYDGKYEGNRLHETFGSPRARTQRVKSEDWVDTHTTIYMRKAESKSCGHQSGRTKSGVDYIMQDNPNGKNPGDVWNITTQPYPESHFAVFPLELVRKPILAGCPVGGTVLDPFGGSGTVGEFCRHNDRNAILFELNPEYKKLIEERAMLKVPELSEWCSAKEDAYSEYEPKSTSPQ